MECSTCHHNNPQNASFCRKCGRKFQKECRACGADLPEDALFCMKCGIKLDHKDTPADAPQQIIFPEADRRQLTVMFCDIVDSTSLSEKLDPEDLRELIREYQETCNRIIHRFEGHIAQYLGDGLLVYFGYPQAHEDDAQRAARTGLAIVEAISSLNTSLREQWEVALSVRVGIRPIHLSIKLQSVISPSRLHYKLDAQETIYRMASHLTLGGALFCLADAYGKNMQAEKGLRVLSEAFVEAENIEERWWKAELFRLRGSLLLQQAKSLIRKIL